MIKKIQNLLLKSVILVLTLGATFFIILSTVEIVANIDIAYIQAMSPVEAQEPINKIIRYSEESGVKDFGNKRYVDLGQLDYMYFPSQNYRVFIGNARKVKESSSGLEKWFMKPNNAHSIVLNKDKSGVKGDYLFYTDQSWKTIPDSRRIDVGDEVKIVNTRGDGYDFRLIERQELKYSETYIPQTSNERQIVIVVENKEQNTYTAFSAEPK
jgi:hypothetical protein